MNEACSLIAEAADPDANIIFGSVIDAHAGDEVRITVIATGFQTRATETLGPPLPRVGGRGRENQMALPMQRTVAAMSMGEPINLSSARYASPPAPPLEAETVNLDEFYEHMEQIPAAPAAVSQQPTAPGGFGIATASEWTPAERPIIRPPVSNANPAQGGPPPRRMASQMPSRAQDELGVEESEFDKPTYLRRGLFAPE
jgi:hypothetical protein